MNFGKTFLSVALCSMMAMNVPAMADTARTAEYNLVDSVNAMSAHTMSVEETQLALAANLSAYQAAAVNDGQADVRFVQALVDTHIYSQDQAQAIFADALSASKNMIDTNASNAVIAKEMSRLAQAHLAGAQFSTCGFLGGTALIGGVAAVVTGVVLSHVSTSCGSVSGSNTTATTCVTNTSPNQHPELSRDLYIGGAIGVAAGIVLLIVHGASGC